MELLGHEVVRIQEDEVSWDDTVAMSADCDVFWWTSTYGFAQQWGDDEARISLDRLAEMGIPTVGHHLDLWWGLDRQDQIGVNPFFEVQHLMTADGDHDEGWAAAGYNHTWMPPGVYGPECVMGTPRPEFTSEVAFVGNHRGYHAEWWPQRYAILRFLRRRYRGRVQFWPRREAIRNEALNDLYASTKVVVGDSCFSDRANRYVSDRLCETIGRGGFLIFPRVPAATEMFVEGEHCAFFAPGDTAELGEKIDYYLAHDDEREAIRRAGQEHARAHHTYEHRVSAIIDILRERGALDDVGGLAGAGGLVHRDGLVRVADSETGERMSGVHVSGWRFA